MRFRGRRRGVQFRDEWGQTENFLIYYNKAGFNLSENTDMTHSNNHFCPSQVFSSVWTKAAWTTTTLNLTSLCPGSPLPLTAAVPVLSVAQQSKRFTSWRSRVKACATSCGDWTVWLRATSSWGRWTLRELTTGHGMWFLKEGWRLGWLDRQCCSTQGHRIRNEGDTSLSCVEQDGYRVQHLRLRKQCDL